MTYIIQLTDLNSQLGGKAKAIANQITHAMKKLASIPLMEYNCLWHGKSNIRTNSENGGIH